MENNEQGMNNYEWKQSRSLSIVVATKFEERF